MKQIVGRKPVLEAINSRDDISQVYIQYGQKGDIINAIRIAAKKRNIKVNEIPVQKFKTFSDHPNTQGIVALISSQRYYTLEQIISSSKKEEKPLLLALDSIQDTHNLGAILRTAECSGVDGVILTKHNSAPVNETVVKTSTGATEHLKICLVNNLVQTLKQLKDEGYWIAGSSLEGAKDYTEPDYSVPTVLVMGNEEKGIRRLTAAECDYLIKIPMKGKIQSLNVSVAAGILLFEINRQRMLGG